LTDPDDDNDGCDDAVDDDQMTWDDDYDSDGTPDDCDSDDDNDGAADADDSDDNNEFVCSDTDSDSCDDCSNGSYDTASECNYTTETYLHEGANLVSFSSLPDDRSVGNMFAGTDGVIGEGVGAVNVNGNWIGSLTSVSQDDGYWVKTSVDMNLTHPNSEPVNYDGDGEVEYCLHEGNNLVSYPFQSSQSLESGLGTSAGDVYAIAGKVLLRLLLTVVLLVLYLSLILVMVTGLLLLMISALTMQVKEC
jgi:hypothetical protein